MRSPDASSCSWVSTSAIIHVFCTNGINFFFIVCSLPLLVRDGYCDDSTNTKECSFDGGDCCGCNVNTQYCTECRCLTGEKCDSTTKEATTPKEPGNTL